MSELHAQMRASIIGLLIFLWEECTLSNAPTSAIFMVVGFCCHNASLAMLKVSLVGREMVLFVEATPLYQNDLVLWMLGTISSATSKEPPQCEQPNYCIALCCTMLVQSLGNHMRRCNYFSHSFRNCVGIYDGRILPMQFWCCQMCGQGPNDL